MINIIELLKLQLKFLPNLNLYLCRITQMFSYRFYSRQDICIVKFLSFVMFHCKIHSFAFFMSLLCYLKQHLSQLGKKVTLTTKENKGILKLIVSPVLHVYCLHFNGRVKVLITTCYTNRSTIGRISGSLPKHIQPEY